MIGNHIWIWFVVGLIPYYINKQEVRNGWTLEIRTLFYSLKVYHREHGLNGWTLRVPLIERLRKAVWAGIMHLRGDDSPQE